MDAACHRGQRWIKIGTKSKGKGQKKGWNSSPKMNKQNLHHQHWPHGQESSSSTQLHPGVGHDSKGLMENPWQARRRCPGWCLGAHGCMYTCWGGSHQRAVLSDSSSESLLSVTECRRACSRGLRRSVDPSSMWMEGTSKWTRSAERGGGEGGPIAN